MNIHPEMLKALRTYYTPGSRVRLVRINDPYTKLRPGDEGSVSFIDDVGTVHINWDCGSTLGVVYGEDECAKIDSGGCRQ